MIWFYRDFLDGGTYIIVMLLSLIFIMAIIGFIMERLQLEEEEKNRMAVLSNQEPVIVDPVEDVEEESTPVTAQSVVPEEVIQKSDKVPAVLDLDQVEADMNNNK